MRKIKRSSELLWLLGIILVALGVSICSKANLGVSMIAAPAFVVSEKLISISPFFTVGVTEYLFQGILLIILCILSQKFDWRYLLAFAVAVIYGYALDLSLLIFASVEFNAIWLRWLMLLVGDVITGFGVACFFRTYMPLQVYELFVSETAKRFKVNINKIKTTFDIVLLGVSLLLAVILFLDIGRFDFASLYYSSYHSIGLGTLVTTLLNAQLIKYSGVLLDNIFEPTALIPSMEKILKLD